MQIKGDTLLLLQVSFGAPQVVVSDVPGCGGWNYAADHGIPTKAFPASSRSVVDGKCIALSTDQLISALRDDYAVDNVLLAGYLKVSSHHPFLMALLNIHLARPPTV